MSLTATIYNRYRNPTTTTYKDFIRGSVTSRLGQLCRTFSLEILVQPGTRFPIALGDRCEIRIDTELVLTGFIEQIKGSGSSNKNKIEVKGRDITADLVDSDINIINDFNGNTSLKGIIEQVIRHIGADIDVVDYSTGVNLFSEVSRRGEMTPARFTQLLVNTPFAPEEGEGAIAPEPGDNCFEYLNKLAAVKSVLLTSTPSGNLAMYRAGPETITVDSPLVNKIGDTSRNNLLSYSFDYNNSKRYFQYKVSGNYSVASQVFSLSTESENPKIVDQSGSDIDGLIRDSRRLVISNSKTGDSTQQQSRATWERDARISKSRKYKCSVQGFKNSEGDIWEVNTIVKVVDDYARIDDTFLVNQVTYNYSVDGPRTAIELVSKDSYRIGLGKITFDSIKKSKNFENAFSLNPTINDQTDEGEEQEIQNTPPFSADDYL